MVKFVIKLIIAILLFACCIYIEDYLQRGAGLFLGMGVTIIGLLITSVCALHSVNRFLRMKSGELHYV